MSDTAEYFETDEPEVVVEKPKKEKKAMSPSKKKALLERLAKGREKATAARKNKQKKAKQLLEKPDEPVIEPVVEPVIEPVAEPVKKVRKAREKKIKIIDDVAPPKPSYVRYKDSDEYKYMKKQIDDIADYMKKNSIKEKRNEVIKEKPAVAAVEPVAVAPSEPKVSNLTIVEPPKPVVPVIPSFSTLRNKKRKNKIGF
tara:strand:+ start:1803 stop:2399 length:597 start_codon:yes stop_codon:yes gene_type:complete